MQSITLDAECYITFDALFRFENRSPFLQLSQEANLSFLSELPVFVNRYLAR